MKKILYTTYGEGIGGGFGDVFSLGFSCYLHAKTKGYEDNSMYVPIVKFRIPSEKYPHLNKNRLWNQRTEYLPWTLYGDDSYRTMVLSEFDEIIDLRKENLFYEGFPGLPCHLWWIDTHIDLNHYYTKKKPYLPIKRTHKEKPYILFNVRNVNKGWGWESKNLSNEYYRKLLDMLDNLIDRSKYDIWKTGEPNYYDSYFDKVIPSTYLQDDLIPLIRNSSLVVSQLTGFQIIPYYCDDASLLRYNIHEEGNNLNPISWKHVINTHNEKFDHHPSWGEEKIYDLPKNLDVDIEDLKIFLDRWLKYENTEI